MNTYVRHYLLGLGASCWNAGIAALYAACGQSVGGVLVKDIPFPTIHEVIAIFLGAAALEALAYFKQNPLPTPQLPVNVNPPKI